MKIALIDSDQTKFPNLALMKLSAYHKSIGDSVSFYSEIFSNSYDKIYISKVFTFKKEISILNKKIEQIRGGSGFNLTTILPENIEHICPDYSLYNCNCSYGFLTRGCPNKCNHCIVPNKEGKIRANAEIEEFLKHDKLILMDNNILAHEHGIKELEKISKLKIKIDINQGIDSKLIDTSVALLFSKIKWLKPIRLACDHSNNIPYIEKAVKLLRENKVTPTRYFCYVLVKDIPDALERVEFLKKIKVDPFAQPFRDFENKIKITKEQKLFAKWCNIKEAFWSMTFQKFCEVIQNKTNKEYNKKEPPTLW